jgi:hypothetical protein
MSRLGEEWTTTMSRLREERATTMSRLREERATMSKRSQRRESWQLRAQFAAALSSMYGREVPAYRTLVEVSAQVNRELDGSSRVTAERHGAIRVGNARELADAADLFAAFGMYPVGFYDLRDASPPVPVVSTVFRPIDSDQLARNPFRVFTSMLTTADTRFFSPQLGRRVERFLAQRRLFDPELIDEARRIAAQDGAERESADRFVGGAVAAFALSREPIDRGWYDELTGVSAVAADIAGVTTTHINHLTPRVLDIDELYRRMTARGMTMTGSIQGPPRWRCPNPAGSGATTSPRPTRRWPPQVWPTTTVAIRRNPLSTKISYLRQQRGSSDRTSIPTLSSPTKSTVPDTACAGWPARSAITFTIRTTSTRKSRHHDHYGKSSASDHRRAADPGPQRLGRDRIVDADERARHARFACRHPDHRGRAVHRRRDHA